MQGQAEKCGTDHERRGTFGSQLREASTQPASDAEQAAGRQRQGEHHQHEDVASRQVVGIAFAHEQQGEDRHRDERAQPVEEVALTARPVADQQGQPRQEGETQHLWGGVEPALEDHGHGAQHEGPALERHGAGQLGP